MAPCSKGIVSREQVPFAHRDADQLGKAAVTVLPIV